MNITTKICQLKNWLQLQLSPNEIFFKRVFKRIDMIEGFLKSPQQERWFFIAAKHAPSNAVIVEIGSFKGRSTVSFGFGCRGTSKHVYAIDLFEGDNNIYGAGDFLKIFNYNVSSCGLSDYVTPMKMHSLEAAKKWDRPIDILFIDGSHEYEDVKADFFAFYPFVKPGGIIALHDIRGMWIGVIKFWEEIKEQNLLVNTGTVSSLGHGIKPM